MSGYGSHGSSLRDLPRLRASRRGRASSWDRTGGNDDRLRLAPGETRELARIVGAGCVNHIWITVANDAGDRRSRTGWFIATGSALDVERLTFGRKRTYRGPVTRPFGRNMDRIASRSGDQAPVSASQQTQGRVAIEHPPRQLGRRPGRLAGREAPRAVPQVVLALLGDHQHRLGVNLKHLNLLLISGPDT